jgi:hypothetical protein
MSSITIPQLNVERVRLRLRGTHPLLINNWAHRQRRAPDDMEAAKFKHPETGEDCVPATVVKHALVSVGKGALYTRSQLRGALFVAPEYIPLRFGKCVPEEYTNDDGVTYISPEYRDWYLDIDLTYSTHVISLTGVLDLTRHIGATVGIGWRRPEVGGPCGTFQPEAA